MKKFKVLLSTYVEALSENDAKEKGIKQILNGQAEEHEVIDLGETRLRVINYHTGEVKETSCTEEGMKALRSVLDREFDAYSTGYLKGRSLKEDIAIEGDGYLYRQMLTDYKNILSEQIF